MLSGVDDVLSGTPAYALVALLLAGALALTAVVVRRRPSAVGVTTAVRRRSNRLVGSVASWSDPQAAVGVVLSTGLVAAVITGAAFTVVTEDVLEGGGVTFLDQPLLRLLAAHRTPLLTALARAATLLGSVPVVLLVTALVAAALWRRDRWSAALLVVAVLGSGALTFAAKLLVHRDRPALPLAIDGAESGFAFPSGHSLTSLVLYAALAYLLVTRGRSRLRVPVGVLLLVPVAVGASRVYLGYHWLTNVAGSWTLAALWLTAVVTADRLLRGRALLGPQALPRTPPELALHAHP